MIVTGRITADAIIKQLESGKKVVNFNLAENDTYYDPTGGDLKTITTFYTCAYWLNPNLAQYLTKGTLVEITGRIKINTYIKDGETKTAINLHVNYIKPHGGGAHRAMTGAENNLIPQEAQPTEPADDLPF